MNKQNIITITLVMTGLALNPIMAEEQHYKVLQNKIVKKTVTSSIAKILHKRGLDEDVADEIAINFVSDEDEILLAMLLHQLELHNIVSKEEVLEFLSHAALHKKRLDFKSYDHMIGMGCKIKQEALDKHTLKQLHSIVKINKELFV